ncbi:MAG: leucine-rich repeat domain-containing protein [Ruminococcaceae bacterium]|nr:leucine-rich repeat domain-containing protein [Oscillospiraceae bacterium]
MTFFSMCDMMMSKKVTKGYEKMKICPMCGMMQLEKGLTVCRFCGYEEKPMEKLSQKTIRQLMAPYEYEITEDGGCRIIAVKNIRDLALRGAVSVPGFVTEIGEGAYSGCKFLASIELPKALRSIGNGAFAHCRDLFNVFLPESVTCLGRGIFTDCYDLGVVRCAASEKPEGWDNGWLEGCDARVAWASADED